MRFFLFFLFGLFSIPSFSQLSDSLRTYYSLTNKAELNIVENNLVQAINNYEKAFAFKKNPFEPDIYNYAVCNALLGKKKACYDKINYLVSLGYPLDSIVKKSHFTFLKSKRFFKKLVLSSEHPKYDKKYRHFMDSILNVDQMFRKINNKKEFDEIICVIDTMNAQALKKHFEEYGLPTEEKLGLRNFPIEVIFMHHRYSSPCFIYSFVPFLMKGIYSGELDSRRYTFSVDEINGYYSYTNIGLVGFALSKPRDKTNRENKPPEKIEKVIGFIKPRKESRYVTRQEERNLERKDTGLCTIEEAQKKILFQLKNDIFHFSKRSNSIRYSVTDNREQYLKNKENIILIE